MKAIASIWSSDVSFPLCHGARYLTPPIPDRTHTLPEQPMTLEHLSGNQARDVFLLNSPPPPIMSRRGGCVHILVHCHFPLTQRPLPPAKMLSPSPFPGSPSCLLKAGHTTNFTRDSSSSNTNRLQPLCFQLNTFYKRGSVCVWGGAGSDRLSLRSWAGFAGVGVVQMPVASPPVIATSSLTTWKPHGHSAVTMAQALNTVFVCQLL